MHINLYFRNLSLNIMSKVFLFVFLISVLSILIKISWNSVPALSFELITSEASNFGKSGGLWPVIKSTIFLLILSSSFSLSIGVLATIGISEFLMEHKSIKTFVLICIDVLSSIPSVVFGLFGHLFFVYYCGLGISIISGALSVSCMLLPMFIRIYLIGLNSTDDKLRQNIAALHLSKPTAIMFILIPNSTNYIFMALSLSVARAMAETAALLFTSGYVLKNPQSIFDAGRVMSVHIYDLVMNVPGGESMAYVTAFLLLILVLIFQQLPQLLTKGKINV